MLKTCLEEPDVVKLNASLLQLRQSHPALTNGRLGQLFSYCESAPIAVLAREEDNEPSMRNYSSA